VQAYFISLVESTIKIKTDLEPEGAMVQSLHAAVQRHHSTHIIVKVNNVTSVATSIKQTEDRLTTLPH